MRKQENFNLLTDEEKKEHKKIAQQKWLKTHREEKRVKDQEYTQKCLNNPNYVEKKENIYANMLFVNITRILSGNKRNLHQIKNGNKTNVHQTPTQQEKFNLENQILQTIIFLIIWFIAIMIPLLSERKKRQSNLNAIEEELNASNM